MRKTEFAVKLVAANIDTLVITCAIEPEPSLELIDHYIVAAENLPASSVIVINKTDLSNANSVVQSIQDKFIHLPYPIVQTNVENSTSIDQLIQILKNNTCVFVGQSGVGKSTLINSIIPSIMIDTQSISEGIQQGKHTTSVTTLYDLPQGGEVIDSPGVRDFLLPKLDKDKILNGFCEIRELGRLCKFHNCSHLSEPGCAVKNALKIEELNKERYESYKKMMQQHC